MFHHISGIVIIMSMFTSAQTIIPASHPDIHYFGRVEKSGETVSFDWPGILIKTSFSGSSCAATFEGMNRFDVFIDGIKRRTITVTDKKAEYILADNLTGRTHRVTIVKRSESPENPTHFYSLRLNQEKKLIPLSIKSTRKIEFIGDSYTAGFASEHLGTECKEGTEDSIIFSTTNTNIAFGPIVSRAFGAEYQINAISGKGLVRNYNGIDKGNEFPGYYKRTLISDPASTWNFTSWHPDVVVIGIGINDFQADPPYADTRKFDSTYHALIASLSKHHQGVKIICCATKIFPNNDLIPRIQAIVSEQKKRGNQAIRYFEYATENNALFGHPHIHDHKAIAEKLIPVVADISGWRRTDMNRGK